MNNSTGVRCIQPFDVTDPSSLEYFFAAFIPIVCSFGAAGNIAIIWVLSGKRFDNHTYTYLWVLATVQLTTLVIQAAYIAALAFIGTHYVIGFVASNIMWPIYSFGTTSSLILTVLYTVERFIHVRSTNVRVENKAQQVKARWISGAVLLTVAILNLPRMLVFDVSDTNPPCLIYRWGITSNAFYGVYTMVRFFIFNLGSIATLLICNSMLLILVTRPIGVLKISSRPSFTSTLLTGNGGGDESRKSTVSMSSQNRRAAQQRSVTITVICATFLALACEIYIAVFNPISETYTWGKLSMDKNVKRYLRCSTFGVYSIEYSGNIVVYYILNNKFRESLLKQIAGLFGKSTLPNHQQGASSNTSHDDNSQQTATESRQ